MLTVTEIDDRRRWNAMLRDLPCAHILQTWEWGELKAGDRRLDSGAGWPFLVGGKSWRWRNWRRGAWVHCVS